jgi:D-alanine-D-alanine ligase
VSSTPREKLRVAVLFGGRSAEHEISLLSARFVVESLDPARFEPVLVGIDKSGRWSLQEPSLLLEAARDPRAVALDATMPNVLLPPHPDAGLVAAGSAGTALGPVDVVFPVLHGPLGEDGTVQGLLELSGVPYVGSGVLGSAVGMDKDVMKRLLAAAGLPIVPYRTVRRARWERERDAVLAEIGTLGLPVFVKPANLGSSVGVSRVTEAPVLAAAVELALEFDDKVVIETGLAQPKEIEVAVLGGDEPFASVPGEIVVGHSDGFYSYAAKYLDADGAVTRIPAALDDAQSAEARRLALATFAALEAEGLARVDLFLDAAGRFWVNEINTLPGFTAISMFPKLMEASGIGARELVTRLIEDARTRSARRQARRTTA